MFRELISRNLKIYFRDHVAVFFSLLSAIIVIVLYTLFLAELQIESVNSATNNIIPKNNISYLVNSWILSGLLSITTVTSTLGAFGTMVDDIERKIMMDFKSSPISGAVYPIASIITACIVGTIMSIISFVFYSVYIYILTGYYFSMIQNIQCLGLIILSSLMSAALMGFVVSLFKGTGSFTAASLIIGTMIGFLNGLYVPIGSLPEIVRKVIQSLPFGHIASIFRQILMKQSILLCFEGAQASIVDEYNVEFGINLELNNKIISTRLSIYFITLVFIISLILFFITYSMKKEEI